MAERNRAAELTRTGVGGGHHGDGGPSGAPGAPGRGNDGRGGPAPAPSAAAVLAALGVGGGSGDAARAGELGPVPTEAGLARALDPLLRDGSLGGLRAAAVVDAATGRRLYGVRADEAAVPASTIKLATAVAALAARGPEHRIETTAVAEPDGGPVVLVGGGDPTLTARGTPGSAGTGAVAGGGYADLRTLADGTARALTAAGTRKIRLGYDTSRYTGPVDHPIGTNENITPVTPLMLDEGRTDNSDSGPAPRSADPAGDTARAFAELLRERGIEVDGAPASVRAGAGARRLAAVQSPPLAALVERMLTHSDNDIAEALARQTALADGAPADFEGAGRAVAARLAKLGLPVAGARFADGSGLSRDDRVSAELLARLLALAADPGRPELRPVLTGLPVAGFSGTLSGRYGGASAGAGVVRAKTGTLRGVSTLAGTVADADGRLLVFAFLTNGHGDEGLPPGAPAALDRLADTIATCGCR
ncbi:D-alanyl-D-alanine carboxypeptidase/D-alanyl-D-alanine endopeptidase [Streptomyces sp. URMC 123]|uniref:D-alanyl-D-alanine carboxypeptidase/D-alanyl-D-alanine endopeptidase n=1 Tax=Streptomyces sp. URMC 123 TaxID=3423403 RepID=UPI003F1C553B